MAGVSAPVPGSTSAPACTATVSILMTSLPVGGADHSLVGGAVSGAQHDAVFGLPVQRHARLARQLGGLPVRHVHPERSPLHADMQTHDGAEERDDVHHAVESVAAVYRRRGCYHTQLL